MRGAFSSEWVKLRRRSMLGWGFGAGLFFPVLATILTIERAVRNPTFDGGRHGIRISYATLEQPTGLVHGVVDVSSLIGLVALCLFAAAFSLEYSQGTLRNLLVREPRRARLLGGKFLALVLFIGLVVIIAVGVSVAFAFALAPGKGISTAAWTSSTGVNDMLQAVLHAFLAAVLYGVFGAALGILLRSPAVSIPVAVAYFLPIEAIITGAIWSGGANWLPNHLLVALAHGGNGDSTYSHALLMLVIYAAVVAASATALFRARDA
ncbi:MAG TPA: ABC transporter permease [Solirubrobacteraceae bacterium]|jgi:ABC-type transport system involved in multi-copper enzyme maturation permease subunit|nr:ABC transporter permease [Solirubrobacteraceae bacterium]